MRNTPARRDSGFYRRPAERWNPERVFAPGLLTLMRAAAKATGLAQVYVGLSIVGEESALAAFWVASGFPESDVHGLREKRNGYCAVDVRRANVALAGVAPYVPQGVILLVVYPDGRQALA